VDQKLRFEANFKADIEKKLNTAKAQSLLKSLRGIIPAKLRGNSEEGEHEPSNISANDDDDDAADDKDGKPATEKQQFIQQYATKFEIPSQHIRYSTFYREDPDFVFTLFNRVYPEKIKINGEEYD
jgi:hypothetical protein